MIDKLAALDKTRKLFYKNYDDPDYAKNYAEQLQICLNDGLITVEDAREEYDTIQTKYPRLYHIKNFFAEALAPWVFEDIGVLSDTLAEVEDYYHRNPDNESLAESYALSLWLLFEHPKTNNRESILNSFSELINAFPDNETIVDKYYQVLALYDVFHINENATEKTVAMFEEKKILTESDAIEYAKTLFDYSKSQDQKDDLNILITKFDSLYKQFTDTESIKELYVKTLYNALALYDDNDSNNILDLVSEVQHNSSSETIASIYALILEDTSSITWEMIEELRNLYEKFPSNDSIIDSYGFALSSIIKKLPMPQKQHSAAISLFLELLNDHPESDFLLDYLQ